MQSLRRLEDSEIRVFVPLAYVPEHLQCRSGGRLERATIRHETTPDKIERYETNPELRRKLAINFLDMGHVGWFKEPQPSSLHLANAVVSRFAGRLA